MAVCIEAGEARLARSLALCYYLLSELDNHWSLKKITVHGQAMSRKELRQVVQRIVSRERMMHDERGG